MIKEQEPNKTVTREPESNCAGERTILANLIEALKRDGWNEKLLHQTVQKILEKETQK